MVLLWRCVWVSAQLALFNEVAIERELSDDGIDLAQPELCGYAVFEVFANEVITAAGFDSQLASFVAGGRAVFLGVAQQAQDAAHGGLAFALI